MVGRNTNGGATEADGRASAPVGPIVAMPLKWYLIRNGWHADST